NRFCSAERLANQRRIRSLPDTRASGLPGSGCTLQNFRISPRESRCRVGPVPLGRLFLWVEARGVQRKKDGEHGATLAGCCGTPEQDRAVMVLHNALAHPKSQSCTDIPLGGKKRLEQFGTRRRGNAAAGVGDREPNPLAHSIVPLPRG